MRKGEELTTEEYAQAMEEIAARAESDDEIEAAGAALLSGDLFSSDEVERIYSLEASGSWSEDDVKFASEYAETTLQAVTGFYDVVLTVLTRPFDEWSGLRPPEHLSDLHGDFIAAGRETLQFLQAQVDTVKNASTEIEDREALADFQALVNSLESGPLDPELEQKGEELTARLDAACLALKEQLEAELERDVSICGAGEPGATSAGTDTEPAPTAVSTPAPTATATPEPTATAAPQPTATATPKPTGTAAPQPTATAVPEPVGASNEADREALVALYHATDGPDWENNDNWLSDKPLGEWYGVTTDRTGRVTRLTLSSNELSGDISPELGNLASLEWLKLSSNELKGEIPAELGNLSNLEWLRLYRNGLSGEIPPELGNLVNLEILELRNNELSGEIPPELGNLVNLRTLTLFSNELSGEIPAELGNLASLEWLKLISNELSGEIPAELGRLVNLRSLEISGNRLSGEIPEELGNLASLEFLFLDRNRLSGGIPAELGHLASLETLLLNHNELSGEIPSELGNLASLKRLNVSRNRLSGCVPSGLRDANISTDGLEFC